MQIWKEIFLLVWSSDPRPTDFVRKSVIYFISSENFILFLFLSNFKKDCDAFLSDEDRKVNFDQLSERLQVWNVTAEVTDLSNEIINDGGEMFVYLNSCPAFHWQNFYHHLLFDKSNTEIILSVLYARKNSRTKGSRILANKVLGRMADILGFEYNRFENEEWMKSLAKIKGKQTR